MYIIDITQILFFFFFEFLIVNTFIVNSVVSIELSNYLYSPASCTCGAAS